MVKVLFLEPTLAFGGAEHVLLDLVTNLDTKRFTPKVACCYDPGIVGERLMRAGVTVFHNLFRSRLDLGGGLKLIKICQRERFDVLYTFQDPLTMFWGRLAGKLAGMKGSVMAVHSTRDRAVRKRHLLNRLVPFEVVIALSETHKEYLIQEEDIPARAVRVVHVGIDPKPYLSASPQRDWPLDIPQGVPLVGIVAMLRPEKAHDVFLQAAALVSQDIPAHFIVVGDGPQMLGLQRMASGLGLDDRVHFLGRRDDVPRLMACMDVVVLSSGPTVETFPASLMEAMAAGKPVVSTDVGSIRDLVVDGQTGLLTPHGDPRALGQGILFLLTNPDTARRMGLAARERLLGNFTLERMVRRTEQLLDELIGSKES